jgi:hypothetical protein
MASSVSVPVLWNANNDFLAGTLMGVKSDAYVVGIVSKPSGLGIPGYPPPASVDTLLVKDKYLGDLYLNITLEQWRGAISNAQGAPLYVPLFDHTDSVGNVNSDETTLYSDIIQGNALAADGDKLEIVYGGSLVGRAVTNKVIRAYFGGSDEANLIFDCTSTIVNTANAAWDLKITLMRTSATSIKYTSVLIVQVGQGLTRNLSGEITGVDLTANNPLILTGQSSNTGAATDDIIAAIGTVAWVSNA